MTPYELFQLEKYGNVLQSSTGLASGNDENRITENHLELINITESENLHYEQNQN